MKIIDVYCHQGNQAEFFKLPHKFYFFATNGQKPAWNTDHRKLPKNAFPIDEINARTMKYDVVIVRSALIGKGQKRYEYFQKKGAVGIACIQTTDPFAIPPWVKHVVWNSYSVMKKWKEKFPGKKHYYIPHGLDPNEFQNLELERIPRLLSVCNVFKQRNYHLGYDLWEQINQETGLCDVWGHGNEDMNMGIRQADSFEELLKIYNSYQIYLNTTMHSAMPRARCEALFTATPVLTTSNYDIDQYLTHKKNAILTNDKDEMIYYTKELLSSKDMREEIGNRGREAAIKHFHLNDYIERWQQVFRDL